MRRLRADDPDDGGSAVIEFIFVAIVFLVPLVYLIASVAVIQRAELGVTQAARDAGRAYATSTTAVQASLRAQVAVRLALKSQGLATDVRPRYVPSRGGCDQPPITPSLAPGAEFMVCVTIGVRPPGVPHFLEPHPIMTTGAYIVHIDDFRAPS